MADATASIDAPTVFFDDTSNGTGDDWEVLGLAGAAGLGLGPLFAFGVVDDNQLTVPLEIDSVSNNDLAFFSDENGDVSFAGDAVFVDRTNIRLGIGTITPASTSTLHVMKSDGTAKILAEEINAAVAPCNMFELINNGHIGFNMTNSGLNQTWRFAAQTTGFRVSLDGTGGSCGGGSGWGESPTRDDR